MKRFSALREKKKMPAGEHVSSKRVNRHTVMIHKDNKGFVVYIDGDKLDTFRSEKEAEKVGTQFAKDM
jgi:predicted transcriptional regulator